MTAAAAGLLAGCKVSTGPAGGKDSGDLAQQLQGVAEGILADFPQNATILGIAKGKFEPFAHEWQDQTRQAWRSARRILRIDLRRCAASTLRTFPTPTAQRRGRAAGA